MNDEESERVAQAVTRLGLLILAGVAVKMLEPLRPRSSRRARRLAAIERKQERIAARAAAEREAGKPRDLGQAEVVE